MWRADKICQSWIMDCHSGHTLHTEKTENVDECFDCVFMITSIKYMI